MYRPPLFKLCIALCVCVLFTEVQSANAQIDVTAKICANKARYANSKWRRTGPGSGGAKYFGTATVICYPNYVYWKLTGSGFNSYQCEEEYTNCKFVRTRKIEKVKKEDGKTYYYSGPHHATVHQYRENDQRYASSNNPAINEAWETYLAREGHVDLEHYVDPNGGPDACSSGSLFASYKLDYDKDHQMHLDMMHYHIVVSPIVNFPDPSVHDPSSLQPLASSEASHCFKLNPYDTTPDWSDASKLEGTFISHPTAISYTVRGGRVGEAKPMKACCDADKQQCLKLISVNETCPAGSLTPPGVRGDGWYTPCALCSSLPVNVAPQSDSADSAPAVACCLDKCVNTKSAISCAKSGGIPLESGGACPKDRDPCIATPPEPSPSPSPTATPQRIPGACTLSDDTCIEVESAGDCWKHKDHTAFIRGGTCKQTEGGCCDDSGACKVTTYKKCKGDFFVDGCPEVCPESKGSCSRYCPEINREVCQYTTRTHCKLIIGSTFTPGLQCLSGSGSLDCNENKVK